MTSLLERIGSTFAARKRKTAGDYEELVSMAADGRDLDPEAAAEALDNAGKTPGDLAADVAKLVERRRLRAMVDAVPGLEAEKTGLMEKVAAADAILKKADDKHTETTNPLFWRLEDIEKARAAGDDAKRVLRNTCTDSAILDREKEIRSELADIDQHKERLATNRQKFEQMALRSRDTATNVLSPSGQRTSGTRDTETYCGYVRDIDKQLADLTAQQAKLVAESAELDERRLEP